jgi:hypothetical protein
MAEHGTASRLFGALVIGGSMLLPGCAGKSIEGGPGEGVEQTPPDTVSPSVLAPLSGMDAAPDSQDLALCQIMFSLSRYDRDGVREHTDTVCLDEKTDEEILTVIREAREETCQSPFCGCWLG